MTKAELRAHVEKLIAADSCCSELKEIGQAYLDACGTEKEAVMFEELIAELKEDVCTIDDVIPFFGSEHAEQLFGKELAAQMLTAAQAAKANGTKWCICGACTEGGAILDNAASIEA